MFSVVLTSFSGMSPGFFPSPFYKYVVFIKNVKTFDLDTLPKQKQRMSETPVGFFSAFSLFCEQVSMPKLYILQ